MNQLSNNVIDSARYRRAESAARRLTAPDLGGQRRRDGLLDCRCDSAQGRFGDAMGPVHLDFLFAKWQTSRQ
jgi:hypothetical protein